MSTAFDNHGARRSILLIVLVVILAADSRAAIDESRLPPAATNRIDFLRDIKPILDSSCLKCHGPEKPKSGFRVDDRTALLKGGAEGVAVVPGDSAKSPLIHYVTHLVPEMEMPPKDKGEALRPAEIALLRAWIDQGAPWDDAATAGTTTFDAATIFGWTTVRGDERKFRELHWRREGWDGGLRDFHLQQQLSPERRLTMEGRALRDDYRLSLSVKQSDRLFVRGGFEQFRRYYDDSGGYYAPFTGSGTPFARLNRNLHLDLGKAWLEAGGITTFGLHLTAGYEYHFKEGEKALTQWRPTGPPDDPRNILPASRRIDESLHVLRLDAGYETHGVRFDDHFRYEFYDLRTHQLTTRTLFPSVDFAQRIRERESQQNLANAFKVETQPREWLLLSAGYLYSHTDGDNSFRHTPEDSTGALRDGLLWNGRGITLEQAAHLFNANAQFGLWEQMTFSAGLQTEWNRQRVFGNANLDEHEFGDPTITNLNPARVKGDYDRFTTEEKFVLRNTQLPFTVLFAEARFKQERIEQLEAQITQISTTSDFLRDTEAEHDWKQYRAGFNLSPWSRVAFNGWAQRRERESDFDHRRDEKPPGNPGAGYPGFILERRTIADELGARLVLRPASWLKTTLSYKVLTTDFRTTTDGTPPGADSTPGGRVRAGDYDAHIYSLNATLTPWRRLYFFSTFAFQDTRTRTANNSSPSIAPFRGHIYSVLTTASYAWNELTDLNLSYDFSYADYGQNNLAAGLPLGIDYRSHGVRAGLGRRFWKRFAANLEYVFSYYDEPSSGHFNDFTANGVFATLRVRWD